MSGLPPELAAADRNHAAILPVLREVMPACGTILEIASGGGQHAGYFAPAFPDIYWQPSDADPERVARMAARIARLDCPNLRTPVVLDVCAPEWPVENGSCEPPVAGIVNVNMIHVAPWTACESLFAGAARLLPTHGPVYLYGPFRRDGAHTSEGNAAFDRSLRERNPEWGLRDLSDVCDAAFRAGLVLDRVVEMPVNNLSVVFRAANAEDGRAGGE